MRLSNCWTADIKIYDVSGFQCSLEDLPRAELAKLLKAIAKGHQFGTLDIPDEYWYGTSAPEGMTKQEHIEIMELEKEVLSKSAIDNFKINYDNLEIDIVETPLPAEQPLDEMDDDEEEEEEIIDEDLEGENPEGEDA